MNKCLIFFRWQLDFSKFQFCKLIAYFLVVQVILNLILQFTLESILKVRNLLNSYLINRHVTLVNFVVNFNLFIFLDKNWNFECKYCEASLTLLDGDISSERSNDLLAASKSHSDIIILNLSQVLFHLQLHKWNEQHFLPLFRYSYSWIYYLCFKYMGLFLIILFNFWII